MQRKKMIAANWKMNGRRQFAQDYIHQLAAELGAASMTVGVVLCPPAVLLADLRELAGKNGWSLGAQNVAATADGAFTGEVSAPMFADAGCRYAIVGHSERRSLFGETDATVKEKLRQATAAGLVPILCVGESLQEREAGRAQAIVEAQLRLALESAAIAPGAELVVAYEPVWAIGTGKTASASDAQAMHEFIRAELTRLGWDGSAVTVLYGGSVKAASAAELFSQPDIDGGLVGGASLDAAEFAAICRAFEGV